MIHVCGGCFICTGLLSRESPATFVISPARWGADAGLLGLGENFESEKGCVMEQKKSGFCCCGSVSARYFWWAVSRHLEACGRRPYRRPCGTRFCMSQSINLFGIRPVNPGFISSLVVTAAVLIAAALIRVLVIPKFREVPGRFQMMLEQAVGIFDGLAKSNSPWRNSFLGAYVFAAGAYIFFGTLFELFGVQAITTNGTPITLPAPLSDVNAAIMLGALSYGVIVSGAIAGNGLRGIGSALKEISLLISMSFRLFGALLSGLLVTELVYYYTHLSVVLPVIVAVLFTLLHALIQSYVLTMLTALFYGEMSESKVRRPKAPAAKAKGAA